MWDIRLSQINISYLVVQGKPPRQHNFCQGRIWMSSHSFTRSVISPRVRSETWILTKNVWRFQTWKKARKWKPGIKGELCFFYIQWRRKRIFRTLLCAYCIAVTVRLQCIIWKVCFLRMSRFLPIRRLFHNLEALWKKKIITLNLHQNSVRTLWPLRLSLTRTITNG